jgi:hypothetical protein
MHKSTKGMSPSQNGLQVCFRKNVHFGPFSWVIAHASGQFSGTAKPDGFRKTHVVVVVKCPKVLQSELQISNNVPTFRAVFVAKAHASCQFSGTDKPVGFHKTHIVGVLKCP